MLQKILQSSLTGFSSSFSLFPLGFAFAFLPPLP